MFKCWIYISGENQNSQSSQEHISDKSEIYGTRSKEEFKDRQSPKLDSYIPGMRRFGFFTGL